MRLNNKEVIICRPNVRGAEREDDGYISLNHGDVYRISLKNDSNESNDVIVEIDGKEVGDWRLSPYQTAIIERPANDTGKFTFYEINSIEAQQSELNLVSKDELGLIKVTFIPEMEARPEVSAIRKSFSGAKGCGQSMDLSVKTRGAGGTGLSGTSAQTFGRVEQLNRDYNRQTVIFLRLVAKEKDSPRPLQSISSISTLIPPPVN